jgi:hypothetical protein
LYNVHRERENNIGRGKVGKRLTDNKGKEGMLRVIFIL